MLFEERCQRLAVAAAELLGGAVECPVPEGPQTLYPRASRKAAPKKRERCRRPCSIRDDSKAEKSGPRAVEGIDMSRPGGPLSAHGR
jgi:hypothetical protein